MLGGLGVIVAEGVSMNWLVCVLCVCGCSVAIQ